MAPTLVFRTAADGSRGDFFMGTGSPGGSTIIQYVAKTDHRRRRLGARCAAGDFAGRLWGGEQPGHQRRRREHRNIDATNSGNNDPLVTGLRALGHVVPVTAPTQPGGTPTVQAQSSGISTIIKYAR